METTVHNSSKKSKVVITKYKETSFLFIYEDDELVECHPLRDNKSIQIGNIYIGRVEKVVKNIQSAFVRLDDENVGYLPLNDAPAIVLNRMLPKGLPSISENDLILVQVEQEPQKLKQARVTGNISLGGELVVLDLNDQKSGVSKKIKNQELIHSLKDFLQTQKRLFTTKELNIWDRSEDSFFSFGCIFRTACETKTVEDILKEYYLFSNELIQLISKATYNRKIGCVKLGKDECISILQDYGISRIGEVRTDLLEIKEKLDEDIPNIHFYDDQEYPIYKLLGLESEFKKMLSKKVWLKSGGFLVIEPTEAMVVVDVNSGKSIGKKRKETHIFETNMEAAKEILRQVRLRNLSGIIMIDFINMEEEAHKKELARYIENNLKRDKVPSYLVEITKLGLYEMTRKKVRKPIYEVIYNFNNV